MDVSKLLTGGEWLEIEGIEGFDEFGAFKLKITPIDALEYLSFRIDTKGIKDDDIEQVSEKTILLLSRVMSLVVDWNFEKDGQRIECTQAAKDLYLRRILGRKLKGRIETLANIVINFAFNPESYSKN